MKRILLASLVVTIAFLTLFSAFPGVSPAQEEIVVTSSNAMVSFPYAITFNLEAEASAQIVDVDLKYRVDRWTLIPVSWRVDADFTPGPTVTASWTWDMLETGGLPPGTELEYWWLIEDDTGKRIETEPTTLTYADVRYEWTSVTGDQIALYWYRGDESFAQQLLGAAEDTLQRLGSDTGLSLGRPATVYIYESAEDMRGALIYPQEWAGGIAFADYGIILIGIAPDDLAWGERTMAHELSHLVVHQAIFGPFSDIPTWLDEGLAVYAEGEMRSDFRERFDEATASGELISVRSLSSSFPTDPAEARLSYAESYSLVVFLLDSYGQDKLLQLLDVFSEGSGYDEALLQVYGFDMDGLDARWRVGLGLSPELALAGDMAASL